jgi:hypothetical protein
LYGDFSVDFPFSGDVVGIKSGDAERRNVGSRDADSLLPPAFPSASQAFKMPLADLFVSLGMWWWWCEGPVSAGGVLGPSESALDHPDPEPAEEPDELEEREQRFAIDSPAGKVCVRGWVNGVVVVDWVDADVFDVVDALFDVDDELAFGTLDASDARMADGVDVAFGRVA